MRHLLGLERAGWPTARSGIRVNKKEQEWEVLIPMSKRSVLMFSLLVALLAFSAVSYAAVSDSHEVTIKVQEVNQIELVAGADFAMNFTWDSDDWTLVAPEAVKDTLKYATNVAGQKITVGLDADLPDCLTLKVNGTVALSATACDLINPVTLTAGFQTFDLEYTASCDLRVAPDSYVRTVTYTLLAGTP